MSRQDKSISERHAKTLRELVKKPENKVCADCKRNDPRWASWNLGVFLCIRCSGIHRGMGTHISKVKSVDLDVWTPEQMDSIQKWGNARANLYWEAHLKPGHVPVDHKMESFIRSKYESRRWALEGHPPNDPSILENNREHYPVPTSPPPPPARHLPSSGPTATVSAQQQSLSSQRQSKSRDPSKAQLHLGVAAVPNSPVPISAPQDDLFSLDFHAPVSSPKPESTGAQKDVKNDILSLFASTPPTGTGVIGFQQQVPAQFSGMMGGTSAGIWGTQSLRNDASQPPKNDVSGQRHSQQPFGDLVGTTPQPHNPGLFASNNVWSGGNMTTSSGGTGATSITFNPPFSSMSASQTTKKDDAFGDLWGGFK